MIEAQVENVIKDTDVAKYVFHNYRNTVLTEWVRREIGVDIAMKASFRSSIQIYADSILSLMTG